ncbi:MAG: lactate utilization protein [Acetobacter sp.]|nr:lactate utilization protein [Bacteroides sp.]MCM1340279.1 lactate utilization protein [Acetobacter sp.]MCM1432771.1 lactate utilization protein [Clostridiales bacterium]
MDIEKVLKNLEKNGFKPYYVETKQEVLPIVKSLLKKGESVSNGGSESIKETGIFELITNGDYDFIDRTGLQGEELRNSYIKAFGCDTYFCSSNAVTENGELYNVDGNSNRVACIVYGPRQVIMVVGINKIVKNIDEAVKRVKCKAAPPNTRRLNISTPCSVTGECVSLKSDNPEICQGCQGDTRICCNYVISAKQRHKDRIKIIIVNENLGY